MTIQLLTPVTISGTRQRKPPVAPAGAVCTVISFSDPVYILEWNGWRFSTHIDNVKNIEE